MADVADLFVPFRFKVSLFLGDSNEPLCEGAFSEASGFEATMAPKTVKEGGSNWGEVQLAGTTTFAPVVLKRGVTGVTDLWTWFDVVTRQANYALRYTARIEVLSPESNSAEAVLIWTLANAMPTRFKGPDLSGTATQVAVEELTLVHEGLSLERAAR